MNSIIYLDHAATTRTNPKVVVEMLPFFTEYYGNPSSSYDFSQNPRDKINEARERIAKTLNTEPETIYFTAGGTESDNWALNAATGLGLPGRHIITTQIEHHAILHTARCLEEKGYELTYLPVDENGMVNPDAIRRAIRRDTILVSVMYANNEIGSIQPIEEIGRICRERGVLFHTDAVQAYGHIKIDVERMNIDMLSASGHKFNGPKGTGFLYVRKGINLKSFIHGGAQERGRRAGTENVPGIVGLGRAAELAYETLDERRKRETDIRNHVIERMMTEIPYIRLNGHRSRRLSNNINVCIQFTEGAAVLAMLDMLGICASGGSACTSGSKKPSHVLLALGLPEEIAHGSLRFTLGEENTMEELDYVVDELKKIVEKLREESPEYNDFIKKRKELL